MSAIYNFETNWAASALTVIAAGGTGVPTANIQYTRSSVTAACPRIEIQALNTQPGSEQLAFSTTLGRFYPCHWQTELSVKIVTDRTATYNHGAILSRVRYLHSYEGQRFISPAVSYYEVYRIWASGPPISVEEDEREDATEIRYVVDYGILPTAITTTF